MYITSTKASGFGSNTRTKEIFKDAIDVQTPYDPYTLTIYFFSKPPKESSPFYCRNYACHSFSKKIINALCIIIIIHKIHQYNILSFARRLSTKNNDNHVTKMHLNATTGVPGHYISCPFYTPVLYTYYTTYKPR